MDEKELKDLYDAMRQNGVDLGDYNAFKAHMASTQDRSDFYGYMKKNGVDLGDYNEYEKRLGGGSQPAPAPQHSKSLDQAIFKPQEPNFSTSAKPYDAAAALKHAETPYTVQSEHTTPQQEQDPNDPLGSTMKNVLAQHQQVRQRIGQLNDIYNRSDLPLPKHPYDAGKELSQLNTEQYNLNKTFESVNQAIKFGANVSTDDALQALNQVVHKENPHAPDVSQLPPDQIEQLLPKDNLTAQSMLNRYKNNTSVLENLNTSGSMEQAALRWAKQNPQFFYGNIGDQLNQQAPDDDPTKVAPAMIGQIVHTFLQQPASKEWAASSPERAQTLGKAQDNLFSNPSFKDYAVQQMASSLNQKREDKDLNNGILDIITPGKMDELAQEAYQKGEWSQAEYNAYQNNKVDVARYLRTPSLLNSVATGLDKGINNLAKGVKDLATLKTFGNEDVQDMRDAANEQFKEPVYKPKGWIHSIIGGGAEAFGEMIPMMLTTKGLMGLGLSSTAANATAMALAAEHPIAQQALMQFPDDPVKREGYKLLMLGINAGFGTMVPREKALEGLGDLVSQKEKKAFTDEVVNTINQFTEGKITSDAAKEIYEGQVKGMLDKAADFAGKSLKHNAVMTAQMVGMSLAQDVADKVFGGRKVDYDDMGTDALETAKTAFLSGLPLGALAAHADITHDSKIASSALWEMTSDPDRYRTLIQNLGNSANIGDFSTHERLQNLDRAVSLRTEMDNNPILDNLKPQDRQKYLFQSLAQKVLADRLENTTDNVLRSKIKEQIKQSEAFNGRLIDKTPLEVTEVSKADKEAGVKAYYDDEKNVKKLADKVTTSQPLSDEDLQLQKNFPDQLQKELQKRAARSNNAAIKEEQESEESKPVVEAAQQEPSPVEPQPEKVPEQVQPEVQPETTEKEPIKLGLKFIDDAPSLTKSLGGVDQVKSIKTGEVMDRPRTVKTEQLKIKKQLSVLESLINCI